MPELPEVETIRRDLETRLTGRRVVSVSLLWEGVVDRPAFPQFVARLTGRTITGTGRRGKYLLLPLDDGATLVVHLRMTGRLRQQAADEPAHHHLRARLALDDGTELRFEDQRKFGRLYLAEHDADLAAVLTNIGPEPLDAAFTAPAFAQRLQGRHTRLKALLLDQRFVAGLGNIYVDEALFRARLHPLRTSDSLTEDETMRLHRGIVDALEQGIRNRGTTLSDYRDAWGSAGLNQEQLLVFRRNGRPCPACGATLEKVRLVGRGTHYCPSCQTAPA